MTTLSPNVPTGNLINGQWIAAASGKTFPVLNPATDEPLPGDEENGRQHSVAAPRQLLTDGFLRSRGDESRQLLRASSGACRSAGECAGRWGRHQYECGPLGRGD